MEINITRFFNEACPKDYSASRAEIGQDAGTDTWRAANEDSEDYMLLDNDEKREAFREYAKRSGFSEGDYFAGWSNEKLNALAIQWVSGDIREAGLDFENPDWQEYENDDNNRGNLFKGTDGEIYWYVGY